MVHSAAKVYISHDFKILTHIGVATGSGFIIDGTGLVATNAHVVRHSNNLMITLCDGTQVNGKVHSYDLATDLALVEITDSIGKPFPIMEIGCSANLRVGMSKNRLVKSSNDLFE